MPELQNKMPKFFRLKLLEKNGRIRMVKKTIGKDGKMKVRHSLVIVLQCLRPLISFYSSDFFLLSFSTWLCDVAYVDMLDVIT
jgi:hypothetical protein